MNHPIQPIDWNLLFQGVLIGASVLPGLRGSNLRALGITRFHRFQIRLILRHQSALSGRGREKRRSAVLLLRGQVGVLLPVEVFDRKILSEELFVVRL